MTFEFLLLIIPPLVHPCALYHFKMTFIAFFPFAFKSWDLKNPFKQIGKADTVDFSFVKIIAKAFIKLLCDVLVIVPVNRWFKMRHKKSDV